MATTIQVELTLFTATRLARSAETDPYMWLVFFKIDGDTASVDKSFTRRHGHCDRTPVTGRPGT